MVVPWQPCCGAEKRHDPNDHRGLVGCRVQQEAEAGVQPEERLGRCLHRHLLQCHEGPYGAPSLQSKHEWAVQVCGNILTLARYTRYSSFSRFANSSKPFACKDIKMALTEIMELTNSLDQTREKVQFSLRLACECAVCLFSRRHRSMIRRCGRRRLTSVRLWRRGLSWSADWTSKFFNQMVEYILWEAAQ